MTVCAFDGTHLALMAQYIFQLCKHMRVARLQYPRQFGRDQVVHNPSFRKGTPNRCTQMSAIRVGAHDEVMSGAVRLQGMLQQFHDSAHQGSRNPSFFDYPQRCVSVQHLSQIGGGLKFAKMLFVHQQHLRQNILDGSIVANNAHQCEHTSQLCSGGRRRQ